MPKYEGNEGNNGTSYKQKRTHLNVYPKIVAW